MGDVNRFVQRMNYWCLQGNLGYDQSQRWDIRVGGECDCSSLVIHCLREAGFDTGSAGYTGNLRSNLTARGWRVVASRPTSAAGLLPGDILLNEVNHVAVYVGGGRVAQASIDERGRARGGRSGDQTNYETNVRAFYVYRKGWDVVLRYGGVSAPSAPASNGLLVIDKWFGPACIRRFQEILGTVVDDVLSSQPAVNKKFVVRAGSGWQWVNSGAKGSRAIMELQRRLGVTADGLFGPATIRAW